MRLQNIFRNEFCSMRDDEFIKFYLFLIFVMYSVALAGIEIIFQNLKLLWIIKQRLRAVNLFTGRFFKKYKILRQ